MGHQSTFFCSREVTLSAFAHYAESSRLGSWVRMKSQLVLCSIFLLNFGWIHAEEEAKSKDPLVSHIGAEQFRNSEEETRIQMINMSRQLNVTCVACHNSKNFKDDALPSFKTAREHMKLTQLLIDNGLDGRDKRPKADCYMCHRGQLKPDYREPIDLLIMEKAKKKKQ